MNIDISTRRVVYQFIESMTSINTEDYPELEDKNIDEIKLIDSETLFNLKTKDGECLKHTMVIFKEYESRDEEGLDVPSDYYIRVGEELNDALEISEE